LVGLGNDIDWHPGYMQSRYANWIEGLNGDWLESRQRFFGIPFPVWYLLDDQGEPDYDNPILAPEFDLPVDPASQTPAGFDESQRGRPGGFIADPDALDTSAAPSLTPRPVRGWERDLDPSARGFPT